jgi:hypothetical protein
MGPCLGHSPAQQERRSALRYTIAAPLEYQHGGVSSQLVCSGTLVNLSTTGVLLQTSAPLPVGLEVEIFLPWPLQKARTLAIEVYISGRVVRNEIPYVAVEVDHYEFILRETKRRS